MQIYIRRVIDMTIDEVKTEVRKIEKYYDFNHQTNDYDVLVNLTEIANLILLQNKISYNKALDDFVQFASDMPTVEEEDGTIRPMRLEEMAEKLKAGVLNGED